MYINERELFNDLDFLNSFRKKKLSGILTTIQDVIDGVVNDVIEDEILHNLKSETPGGYSGEHGVQIYLEEAVDSAWIQFIGDGICDDYEELLENEEISEEFEDCEDPYEELDNDVRTLFERKFKNKLFEKGVSKEVIDSMGCSL